MWAIKEISTGYNDEDYYFGDGISPDISLFEDKTKADAKCLELNLRWLGDLENWYPSTVLQCNPRYDPKKWAEILEICPSLSDMDTRDRSATAISKLPKQQKLRLMPYLNLKYYVDEIHLS